MNTKLMSDMGSIAFILMNEVQMGLSYGDWSDEYSYDKIKTSYADVKKAIKETIGDINTLTVDEMLMLGFRKWGKKDVYLIPIWIYDLIPDNTELMSLIGNKRIKGVDPIDLDARFGCIPYYLIK